MRVHRGYLFWGIFFVFLGAIPLADRMGWIDVSSLGDVWRLWPLAVIAAGLAILLARTQAAFVGTVVAAAVIGLIAGGALAYGGGFIANVGDCGSRGATLQRVTANGTFTSAASVDLHLNCGTLDLTTATGSGWSVDAGYRDTAPTIDGTAGALTVRAPTHRRATRSGTSRCRPTGSACSMCRRTPARRGSTSAAPRSTSCRSRRTPARCG